MLLLLLLPLFPLDSTKTSIKHLSFSPLSLCLDFSISIVGQDVNDSETIKEKEKLVDNWVPMT